MVDSRTPLGVFKQNFLFRGLPESSMKRIAAVASRRRYAKGETIFTQGDAGDALYAVASGRVRISATAAGGQEVFLSIMEPGDTFGEIAVMDGLPRTAGATTLEDSTLFMIRRADFLGLLDGEPGLAVHLLKLLCTRLRWTSELVEESAFLTGPERLAKRLLILASLHGRKTGDNQLEIRMAQSELAHFLGISRQIVNQHLRDWQRKGWVSLSRERIGILDADALRRLTDEPRPGL